MYRDKNGSLVFEDGLTSESIAGIAQEENLLEVVFRDGVLVKEQTLAQIRARLHENHFGGAGDTIQTALRS